MTIQIDNKSVLQDSQSVFQQPESVLQDSQSVLDESKSVFASIKKRDLFWFFVQWVLVLVGSYFATNITNEPTIKGLIFMLGLISYPIYLISKTAKEQRILQEKALLLQKEAMIGEEKKVKFGLIKDIAEKKLKTLSQEVKRLQEIEERFLKLKNDFEETAQQRTAYLNADKENRVKLENNLNNLRKLEAEKNELIDALDTESTERQRLADQVQTLAQQNETLDQDNKRLFEQNERLLKSEQTLSEKVKMLSEKAQKFHEDFISIAKLNESYKAENERLLEQTQTLFDENENFEDLIKEFISYQKTLVNGVVGLRVGGALDKDFVKTYLTILEKCKGGAK